MPNRKCRPFVAVVLCLAALLASAAARAQDASGPLESSAETALRANACDLLQQGRYADLDAKMNGVQRDYETGQISDISLLHSFRAFCPKVYTLEDKYDAWVAAFPKSYAARLADGVYLREMAYYWRGGVYYNQLSATQIQTMTDYANRAMEQLQTSLDLTAKPLLSFHAVVGLATIMSDHAAARRALDAADQLDPHNFVVRFKYLASTLLTRWGGSLDEMIAFREEARQAGLPPELLSYFDEEINQEKWWLEHCDPCRGRPR